MLTVINTMSGSAVYPISHELLPFRSHQQHHKARPERLPLHTHLIMLYFERSSIKDAKRVFPRGRVGRCAFHLARSWNVDRDGLGLWKFLKGNEWGGGETSSRKLYHFLLTYMRGCWPQPSLCLPTMSGFPGIFAVRWLNGPFLGMKSKWDIEPWVLYERF